MPHNSKVYPSLIPEDLFYPNVRGLLVVLLNQIYILVYSASLLFASYVIFFLKNNKSALQISIRYVEETHNFDQNYWKDTNFYKNSEQFVYANRL
jgi:hypothetical protein